MEHGSSRPAGSRGWAGSILGIGSVGSILSIGSSGSILSIGSAGSILSIGSLGSGFSLGAVGSIGSVLSGPLAGGGAGVAVGGASDRPSARRVSPGHHGREVVGVQEGRPRRRSPGE